MKRRKEGFSLVELLIVLAVMAALIATITPVALNAIRKAKATRVAQNLEALASSFENYMYVNGEEPTSLTELGRDIDGDLYGISYGATDGEYGVVVFSVEDVNDAAVVEIMPNATTTLTEESSSLTGGLASISTDAIGYSYSFQVY